MDVTVTPGDVFPGEVAGMRKYPALKRGRRLLKREKRMPGRRKGEE